MLEQYHMLSQASIYLRYSEANAALRIDNLRWLLQARGDRKRSVMQRMYRYPANITASPPLLYARQDQVQAIFAKNKLPHALFHPVRRVQSLGELAPSHAIYGDPAVGRRAAVVDTPHIVESYVGAMVDHFTSASLDDVLNAEWK